MGTHFTQIVSVTLINFLRQIDIQPSTKLGNENKTARRLQCDVPHFSQCQILPFQFLFFKTYQIHHTVHFHPKRCLLAALCCGAELDRGSGSALGCEDPHTIPLHSASKQQLTSFRACLCVWLQVLPKLICCN